MLVWNMLQMKCWGKEKNVQFIKLRYHSARDIKDNKRVYIMSFSGLWSLENRWEKQRKYVRSKLRVKALAENDKWTTSSLVSAAFIGHTCQGKWWNWIKEVGKIKLSAKFIWSVPVMAWLTRKDLLYLPYSKYRMLVFLCMCITVICWYLYSGD